MIWNDFNKFLFLHQTSNWDISSLYLKDKYSMVYNDLPVSRWDEQNDIFGHWFIRNPVS